MKTAILIIALLCIAPIQKTYAYLDPGSGSYILQIALGAFLGILVSIKVFWNQIVSFFKKQNQDGNSMHDNTET